MPPPSIDEAGPVDQVRAALLIVLPYCSTFGRAKLRSVCKKWRAAVDAASPDLALHRAATLPSPRALLAARPRLTSLTLTPTHLQQRPDLAPLESHLTSLTVRSNLRGAAWQRCGQGAVLLLLGRLAPLRRLQHLALGDCIVADRWDGLAAMRRLRDLDLGGILEVDNRVLTVLPLLSKLQGLTLPGPEGYSPRYNQCSAHGFALCLQHLKTLSAAASPQQPPPLPQQQAPPPGGGLRRVTGLTPSASCGSLVSLSSHGGLAARPLDDGSAVTAAAAASPPPPRGLTRLEFHGLSYRHLGPEALRHSRPCPLTDAGVLEALVSGLPGLRVLALEEAGGTSGHIIKAVGSGPRPHHRRPAAAAAAAAATAATGADSSCGGSCCSCGGGAAAAAASAPFCPVLQQCSHFEALGRLTALTSLTLAAHVQLEYRDGEARAPTGGSATAPLCDGLLLRWLPPAAPPSPSAEVEVMPAKSSSVGRALDRASAAAYLPARYASDGTDPGVNAAASSRSRSSGTWAQQLPSLPLPAELGVRLAPWPGLQELALREVWELGAAGLGAVCGGALPALRRLDLTGSGRGLGLEAAVAALERLSGLTALRLGRATSCAWNLPDPFGGRLCEEDECARSVSEPCLSASPSSAVQRFSLELPGHYANGQQHQHDHHQARVLRPPQLQPGQEHEPVVSEEFYQDIDWDAFADARHSTVMDLDSEPWVGVSRPCSGVLQRQPTSQAGLGPSTGHSPRPGPALSPCLHANPNLSTGSVRPAFRSFVEGALYPRNGGRLSSDWAFKLQQSGGGGGAAAAAVAAAGRGGAAAGGGSRYVLCGRPSLDQCPGRRVAASSPTGAAWAAVNGEAALLDATSSKPPALPFLTRQHQPLAVPQPLQQLTPLDSPEPPPRMPPSALLVATGVAAAATATPDHRPQGGSQGGQPGGGHRSLLQRYAASHMNWVWNGGQQQQQQQLLLPLDEHAPWGEDAAGAEDWLEETGGSSCEEEAAAVRRLTAAMPGLQELDLGGWPVTAAVIRQLAAPPPAAPPPRRPRLHRLGLAACSLDNAAALALGGLRDLQYIDISSTRPEPFLLRCLAALPGLEEVEVRGCRLYYDSGKAMQQLAAVKAVRGLADAVGLGLTQELRGEHVLL